MLCCLQRSRKPSESYSQLNLRNNDIKHVKQLETFKMFKKEYKVMEVLGKGNFGTVHRVSNVNGREFAAKIIKKKKRKYHQQALIEYKVLASLKHENILQVLHCFNEKKKIILITEYLAGGQLFDKISREKYLLEDDSIHYMKQICEAVSYIHANNIVHLDLKTENIVFVDDKSRIIKIIDFGLSRFLYKGENNIRTTYGTRDYVAPEIIKYDPISYETDCWSLGVIAYVLKENVIKEDKVYLYRWSFIRSSTIKELYFDIIVNFWSSVDKGLSGLMPFAGDTWVEQSSNIQLARYNYADKAFNCVSLLAKSFIDSLLITNPTKRMTSRNCLTHAWLMSNPPMGRMVRTKEKMVTYFAKYKSKSAGRLRGYPVNEANDNAEDIDDAYSNFGAAAAGRRRRAKTN